MRFDCNCRNFHARSAAKAYGLSPWRCTLGADETIISEKSEHLVEAMCSLRHGVDLRPVLLLIERSSINSALDRASQALSKRTLVPLITSV